MGVSISMGTFISMIASCKTEPGATVSASYFTDTAQSAFIENIAEIILPKTDTPGAKEAGVIKYIDVIVGKIYKPEEQKKFNKGLEASMNAVKDGDLTEFVTSKIGANADKDTYASMMKLTEAKEPPTDAAAQNDYYIYSFLNAVKGLAVGGYFGSEIIATEYMVYNPVPGPYQGCIDYDGGNNYYL